MKGGSALLRRQILLITLLVGTVAFVLITVNAANLTRALILRTRDQADTIAMQAATAVEAALVAAPNQTPERAISDSQPTREFAEAVVRRGAPITSLIIEDSKGQTLLQAPKDSNARPLPALEALLKLSFPARLRKILLSDETSYEYSRALKYREQEFGRVRVAISVSLLRGEVLQNLVINLLIALAAIAAATFIAISSARLITAPLRAITSSIEQIERAGAPATELSQAKAQSENIANVADRIEEISRRVAGDRTQLRETRGRLQQVLSNLKERLLLVSADGRIMLASPGIETLLGADQVKEGSSLEELVGADHPIMLMTKRALASREALLPTPLTQSDGTNGKPLTISVQPITDRNETVGALISLHDRETVAKLESQLDYSERLADFARITSGIAHEVKNPLNAMVIHLELLRSKLERLTPAADEARPQLDILTSEIMRLDRVVQTFLDFTRLPSISLRPLDVNRVLEETLSLAAPEAEENGAIVERSFAKDLPKVAGDADLLKQAFLNIVINGFQAMQQGGTLRVATSREGERTVLISIKDEGGGILPEARERIFHLYYTTKAGGHGIGLAQAFRAVQLHNGQISFESEPGAGTTFHLRFPAI